MIRRRQRRQRPPFQVHGRHCPRIIDLADTERNQKGAEQEMSRYSDPGSWKARMLWAMAPHTRSSGSRSRFVRHATFSPSAMSSANRTGLPSKPANVRRIKPATSSSAAPLTSRFSISERKITGSILNDFRALARDGAGHAGRKRQPVKTGRRSPCALRRCLTTEESRSRPFLHVSHARLPSSGDRLQPVTS